MQESERGYITRKNLCCTKETTLDKNRLGHACTNLDSKCLSREKGANPSKIAIETHDAFCTMGKREWTTGMSQLESGVLHIEGTWIGRLNELDPNQS